MKKSILLMLDVKQSHNDNMKKGPHILQYSYFIHFDEKVLSLNSNFITIFHVQMLIIYFLFYLLWFI